MKDNRQRLVLTCLMSVLIMMNACATPNAKQFAFHVPRTERWQDREVRYLEAEDGVRLAYREEGDIRCGRAFILIPGSTMYGYYYVPFMDRLAGDKLYVRTIDLRGHGDSGGPRGDVPSEDSLVSDLRRHIEQIRSVSPDTRIIISGHSVGAGICGKYLEKYGYDSVAGAVYIAPFFHWREPGMKPAEYVDVSLFLTVFGGSHTVTQVYHPASDDPKLVRTYTKMMSRASMLTDYDSFRKNHATRSLYLIGKKDELFDWRESPRIFERQDRMKVIVLDDATHLDILDKCTGIISEWLDSLQVEADVSESNIKLVHVNQPCSIALDALPGERFAGEVDAIVPTVDRSKATVLVKIRFLRKDPRILSEMSAKVSFLTRPLEPGEQRPCLMVDKSAVLQERQSRYAFLIDKGKVRRTEIRTGRVFGDMVEVVKGLKPGDSIVAQPGKGLRDGSEITVIQ